MFHPCQFGGKCIDPGNPSDCEVNLSCVNFRSIEEKSAFDALPDLFVVEAQGLELKFKNQNQLKFFVTDHKGEYKVYAIVNNQHIPIDLEELLRSR